MIDIYQLLIKTALHLNINENLYFHNYGIVRLQFTLGNGELYLH